MNWFIFSIACYSLTAAYLDSPLFDGLRKMARKIHPELAECAQCSGFWISLFVYTMMFKPTGFFDIVLHALFASGMIIFYDKLVMLLLALGRGSSDGRE